jgi:hypothetical protein
MDMFDDICSITHADTAEFCEWSHPIGPVVQLVSALHLLWHWRRGTHAHEIPAILLETPEVSSSTWRSEAWWGAAPMLVNSVPSASPSQATLILGLAGL